MVPGDGGEALVRVPRVFVAALARGPAVLGPAEARHLALVLRLAPGAAVRAFDGRGLEAPGVVRDVVREADGPRVTLELGEAEPSRREAARRLTLAVALLKGDKLSGVVRQGTELGAVAFRPFRSRYASVPELSPAKLARLRRVAQEAAKQSQRAVVPEVCEATVLEQLPLGPLTLVAQPGAATTVREAVPEEADELTLVTGPEGGFSEAEVEALRARGAVAVRLGERVLRAETAPLALAAALLVPEAL